MFKFFIPLCCVIFSFSATAKTVEYEFDIAKTIVNKTGMPVMGMTVGGRTPGPVITAREGDTLRVTFNNTMDVQTSIHWHGILLPNEQDGVPFLTTSPIAPHSAHTFEYPIIQSGTYWYHSHTGLQEQRGVYGAMVLHPKLDMPHMKMGHDIPKEHVVVFSDWSDEDPKQIMRNLKKDGDYYALKKGSVQSWAGVLANGKQAIKNRLTGALSRMGPMDISDVGYDAFLANGQKIYHLGAAKAGETVKLRLVNASASSYFNVEFSGSPMTIIAADGIDVTPFKVQRMRIAIAETYDVLVKIPMDMAYELRATSEDGTGYASAWLGKGHNMPAPDIPMPNLYLQNHDMMNMDGMEHDMGTMDHDSVDHVIDAKKHTGIQHEKMMQAAKPAISKSPVDHSMKNHNQMEHKMPMTARKPELAMKSMPASVIEYMTDYAALKSPEDTSLPQTNMRTVNLSLTGNMERYVWSFNNVVLSKTDSIKIKKGQTVRFVLKNETMMHHPIHLHGHFFRVLNGQGKFSPLKHTVNVPPMETIVIEFAANEEKDWFFHCHNLYHMMFGMARVVSYEGSSNYTDAVRSAISKEGLYVSNSHTLQNNLAYGMSRISNSDTALGLEYDWDYDDEYDVQLDMERQLSRFLAVYGGMRTEKDGGVSKTNGVIGARYILPMLIEADVQLASDGHVELEIGSYLQLTSRLGFEWEASSDEEYRAGLSYALNKQLALAAGWGSEQGWGAGVQLNF